MTQDEIDTMWQQAMRQSIEEGEMFTRYHFAKLVAAKERLAQPEQEPVAWISPSGALYRTRYHAMTNAEQSLTPLYTHPPQRTEQEPVECRDVIAVNLTHEERLVLRQAIWDSVEIVAQATPPQRTWVGLTDEDEIDWEEGGNLKDLVKAIEAKLKEKNI